MSEKELQNDEKVTLGDPASKILLGIRKFMEEHDDALYVMYRDRICPITLHPDSGDIIFQDGMNSLLVETRPDVRILQESQQLIIDAAERRELEEAEFALTSDTYEIIENFRHSLDVFQQGNILSMSEVQKRLDDLEICLKEIPLDRKASFVRSGIFCHKLFNFRRDAAQILRSLLEYLEKKGYEVKRNTLSKYRTPNIHIACDGNRDIFKLIERIAEIIGCEEGLDDFVQKIGGPKNVGLIVLYSGDFGIHNFKKLDSAYVYSKH